MLNSCSMKLLLAMVANSMIAMIISNNKNNIGGFCPRVWSPDTMFTDNQPFFLTI